MTFRSFALPFCLLLTIALVAATGILPALAQSAPPTAASTPNPPPARLQVSEPQSPPALQPSSLLIARVHVGYHPFGIVVNPVNNRAYVANRYSGSVSVIYVSKVEQTIPVGSDPWAQVAVNPAANRIYVPNNGSGTLSVIDGATNTLIATVEGLETAPEGVAIHASRNRIYVSHSGNELSVIDGVTHAISETLYTDRSNHSVVVDEKANRAYVQRTDPELTSVMDLATGEKIAEFDPGGFMALNPDTNRLYIAEIDRSLITVVDTITLKQVATIPVSGAEGYPAINVTTNCVYAPNPGKGSVTVIDATTNTVVGAINGLDANLFAAAVDPALGLVYVTERDTNTVAVIRADACEADPPVPPTATPTPTTTLTPTATHTPTHTPTPVPGAIAGLVWYDADGDAARDWDEPGLYGVEVTLLRGRLTIGKLRTRGDGRYRFDSLPPGDYVVRETQPEWLRFSSTADEAQVALAPAAEPTANFGDWAGRALYLPLMTKR